MDSILDAVGVGKLSFSKTKRDSDVIDRLNHMQTTMLLVMFAVLVTTKQFVGDSITCWVPAHFTGNQEEYTNSYCWVRNTYLLPNDQPVPKVEEADKRRMIPYYQWLPMILLMQALFFYLPNVVWHTFNRRAGVDISSIVAAGLTFNRTEMMEMKEKTRVHMTTQIDRYLTVQSDGGGDKCTISLKHCLSRLTCRACGRRKGNYLVILYLFVKALYVINVITQLFLLDVLLGARFHMYGFDVLADVSSGKDWTESSGFPRVTLCDFNIRRFGNLHRYTVQCVLPINQFNEKIYLFLWFWMVAVAAMTCFSFVKWVFRFLVPSHRMRYIRQHIEYDGRALTDAEKRKTCPKFVKEYLKQDGAFILQLVSLNTDSITATELIISLWKNYCSKNTTSQSDGDFEPTEGPKKRCCC